MIYIIKNALNPKSHPHYKRGCFTPAFLMLLIRPSGFFFKFEMKSQLQIIIRCLATDI